MNSSNKSEYGEILTRLIKEKNMTQEVFYKKLGITKPYFYEIISGKINPPPPDTQMKILKILNPIDKDKERMMDIAARERKELPADVMIFLEKKSYGLKKIRDDSEYKKFLKEIVNKGEWWLWLERILYLQLEEII